MFQKFNQFHSRLQIIKIIILFIYYKMLNFNNKYLKEHYKFIIF